MMSLRDWLDTIEKATRNIARGETAKDLWVARVQARMVKTLQEEGVMPLQLLERGHIHPLETIRKLEEKKHEMDNSR